MEEAQWLTASQPRQMLAFLGSAQTARRISERKLRLFACGVCRRLWPFLADERSRRAVEVSELYADGLAGRAELKAAARPAQDAARELAGAFGANAAAIAA